MEDREEQLDTTSEQDNEETQVKQIFSDYVMKDTERENENKPDITEPNKPAYVSTRIAAFIIDVCLLFLATFGFKTLFDNTSISNDFKSNYYEMCYVADHIKLDDTLVPGEIYAVQVFDDDARYSEPAYKNYTVYKVEGSEQQYKIIDIDKLDGGAVISKELRNAYQNALSKSDKYKAYRFNCQLIDYGLVMFAAGLSATIFIFIVPLTNKRRATVGRLAAGIHLINSKYQVSAKWYQILGRMLFVYVVEMALPQLFLSNAIYTVLFVSFIVLLTCLTNKSRRSINDLVSRTESIDKRTFVPLDEQ